MLQKAFERLVDLATGTFLIEMELPEERRKMVDRLSELNGVKPSTVLRVIAGEALLKDPPFKGFRPEESNSTGATQGVCQRLGSVPWGTQLISPRRTWQGSICVSRYRLEHCRRRALEEG